MKNFRSKKLLIHLAILVLVVVVCGFYYLQDTAESLENNLNNQNQPSVSSNGAWKTYSNTEENFTFTYPEDWILTDSTPSYMRVVAPGETSAGFDFYGPGMIVFVWDTDDSHTDLSKYPVSVINNHKVRDSGWREEEADGQSRAINFVEHPKVTVIFVGTTQHATFEKMVESFNFK